MIPYAHQVEQAKQGVQILKRNMIVYLAWEERTGKTLASMLIAESINVSAVLVVTKKKALGGWKETLNEFKHRRAYTVTTYTQLHKLKGIYDLVILDESHNYISAFPDRSKTWRLLKKFTREKPIIYISATPYAQGYQLLYNQLALSSWSPWIEWKNGKEWFDTYGVPNTIWVSGRKIKTYTEVVEKCFEAVKHLFMTKTRAELGFEQEPTDRIHSIQLGEVTKAVYNELTKSRAIVLNDWPLICDSIMKLRTSLHMLEGGVALVTTADPKNKKKLVKNYIQLGNTEKVDYIKQHWGDKENVVIMYQYIAEKTKLNTAFSKATVLQATSYAEGVDLSDFDHLIIYSQDFSTARHTQRRARQANKNRRKEIIVHYLLVEKAISSEVYKTVSINKRNYVDRLYSGELL